MLALFVLSAGLLAAPESATTPDGAAPAFSRDVAPVLVQKCQGCHGTTKQKGGYRLDTFDRLTHPGDSEAAPVVPGDPRSSEIFRLITHPDEHKRMPQKDDPLPAEQVALIERWIRGGATFDGADRTAPLQTLLVGTHPPAPSVYPFPVPATALAFSPDGRRIAVGGYHEVTVWDAETGKLLARLGGVAQQTQSLAWSPDGSTLAAAGGTPGALGELRLLPADGSSPARLLDRITDVLPAAAFSPDGKLLAAGGSDGSLRVYEVATAKRKLLIEPHADWVTAVAFSPDGQSVATASRDKSARVFDVSSGELHSAYLGNDNVLFAVAWDPNGKRLFTAGRDRRVHAWEPTTDPKKTREITGFDGDILRLAVAGEHVFTTSADGKLRVHSREKGDHVRTTEAAPDWLGGLAVHEKTGKVAAGAFDGSVHVYETATGKPVTHFVAAPGR